jgi:hypothetical protein
MNTCRRPVTDPSGSETHNYDQAGRVTQVRKGVLDIRVVENPSKKLSVIDLAQSGT